MGVQAEREIAEAMGVTPGAVSQWLRWARVGGIQGLRHRIRLRRTGVPPRLTPQEKAQIPRLLEVGAEVLGFRGDIWACGRIAQVIRRTLGVSYHPAHVSRILRACGWSPQKPLRRATQQNEADIWHWRQERWPQVQKKPALRDAPWCS
jgi:transposase